MRYIKSYNFKKGIQWGNNCDLRVGKYFLDKTPQVRCTYKMKNWISLKFQKFCSVKGTLRIMKSQATNW